MSDLRLKAIVICVEYDDLLEISLPRNLRHFSELVVVTAPQDERTQQLVRGFPGVRCHVTDAFYRYGAKFNKGLAMEEGFDVLGRDGWILIWDADIVLPAEMTLPSLEPGNLYGVHRRMLHDAQQWRDDLDWTRLPLEGDRIVAGYFQLFHADDPHLQSRPWYDVTYNHAGGGDAYFQHLWPEERKVWLPFEVLHLGPRGRNWFGRATVRRDGSLPPQAFSRKLLMERYSEDRGWRVPRGRVRHHRRQPSLSPLERVHIPGVQPPDYTY